jgi:stage IV sporulation protein A
MYKTALQDALQNALQGNKVPEGEVSVRVSGIDLGEGKAQVEIQLPKSLYYSVIGEWTGLDIRCEKDLLCALRSLSDAKREYDKYASAIRELEESGYGIVMPDVDSLRLEEPQIVKQAGGYGVRLRASAPSVHMIRASIETEINPVVGTEQQSEELVRNLLTDFEEDPKQIWQSNLFGRSLYELVNDGLHAKLAHMPDDARQKLGETLSRVINEGSGGLICIIL